MYIRPDGHLQILRHPRHIRERMERRHRPCHRASSPHPALRAGDRGGTGREALIGGHLRGAVPGHHGKRVRRDGHRSLRHAGAVFCHRVLRRGWKRDDHRLPQSSGVQRLEGVPAGGGPGGLRHGSRGPGKNGGGGTARGGATARGRSATATSGRTISRTWPGSGPAFPGADGASGRSSIAPTGWPASTCTTRGRPWAPHADVRAAGREVPQPCPESAGGGEPQRPEGPGAGGKGGPRDLLRWRRGSCHVHR